MRQDASSCAISSMEYVKIKLKVEKCIELQKLGQGPFKTCFFKKCIQYSKISSLFLDDWLHQQFRYSWKENQKNSASIIFSKWDYSSAPFLKLNTIATCHKSTTYVSCHEEVSGDWHFWKRCHTDWRYLWHVMRHVVLCKNSQLLTEKSQFSVKYAMPNTYCKVSEEGQVVLWNKHSPFISIFSIHRNGT